MRKKTITVLGSTGSVGQNTLQVVRANPSHFEILGLAAGSNASMLHDQIDFFKPKAVYLKDADGAANLLKNYGNRIKIFTESDGLLAFTASLNADILVAATSGTTSLLSVLDAIKKRKRVALANKEILVMAGALVMAEVKQTPDSLIPVDSEHSAIFQCLQGAGSSQIEKIILTGSGGPLREVSQDKFAHLTKEAVIRHPKWNMGKKISVDSATLMNKGLEIIEASWLFDLAIEQIEVLIHPEAVIHSMVEFKDGATLAQLGVTDMKLPIQYALSYPDRHSVPASLRLDWRHISNLTFSAPDRGKFPCLGLAVDAAKKSGSAPCVLSAADEVAVTAYLEDRIKFTEIPKIIEKVLSNHCHVAEPDLSAIQSAHQWATAETLKLCKAV